MIKGIWRSWEHLFIQSQTPVSERRVRSFLLLFLSLLTLACTIVGLFNLLYGEQRNDDIVIWLGVLLGVLSFFPSVANTSIQSDQ